MMKLAGFVKFYNEEELLEDYFKHMLKFCDIIVACNDSSTDRSFVIAKKYTDDIITLPNVFEEEGLHKQKLLEYAIEKHPDITHFIHLDPDERFDKVELVRPLCEKMEKENIDGIYCHLVNLWLSDKFYRVDNQFNRLWKIPIWLNTGNLRFDTSRGLHKPQNPINLKKLFYSNLQIIHLGFSKREWVEKKYNLYKKHQRGWALERLNPDSKAILKPVKHEISNPKITVGIPAYIDSEIGLRYFRDCLNSCIEQTYQGEMEILIVDDASPEPFGEQVKNISEVFNARYVRNEKNSGIGFTRNRIIEEARGEILYFLSADDMLLPNSVETIMKKDNEDAFYFSDYLIINERGQVIREYRAPTFDSYEDLVMAVIEAARGAGMFICYNLFAKTNLFKKNMFWNDKRYGEDLAHLLECMLVKKIKFIHIPQPLFMYRTHTRMKTSRLGIEKIKENNQDTFNRINKLLCKEVF